MTSLDPAAPSDTFVPGYEPVLRRLGTRLLGNATDADDVTQEALVAAYLHEGGRVRDPESWLRGVTRNMASQFRRSERRRAEVERRPRRERRALPPDTEMAARELAWSLEQELSQLPGAQARAVRGRYLDERSYEAMAAEEGVTTTTIRTRVRRGLVRLREKVDRRLLDHLPAWLAFDLERLQGGDLAAATGASGGAAGGAAGVTAAASSPPSAWVLASPLIVGGLLALSVPSLLFGDLGRIERKPVPAPGDVALELTIPARTELVRPQTILPATPGLPGPEPRSEPPVSSPRLAVELGGAPAGVLARARAWVVEGPGPAYYTGVEAEGPPDVVADAGGRLELPELRPGQALLVRAPGYSAVLGAPRDERFDSLAWIDEVTTRKGWTGRHSLDLWPCTDLALTLCDASGAPLSAGRVELVGERLTRRIAQAGSLDDLLVLRDVPLGVALAITVQAPGAGARVLGPLRMERDPGTLRVELPQERVLAGRVVGRDGRPVADARLTVQVQEAETFAPLTSLDGRLPGARRAVRSGIQTDSEGRFTIRGLAPGDYLIGASRRRLRGEESVAIGAEDASLELEIGLPTPRLSARVELGDGRNGGTLPCTVYASRIVDDHGWREYAGVVDVRERTVLRGLEPGAWIVHASPELGPPSFRAGWLTEGENDVLLDDGEPLHSAVLSVRGGAAEALALFRPDGSAVVVRVGRKRWSCLLDVERGRTPRLELPDAPLRAVVPAADGRFHVVEVRQDGAPGELYVDLSAGELRRAVVLDRGAVESDREAVVALAWSSRDGEVREWLRGEGDEELLRPLLFESLNRREEVEMPSWRLRGFLDGGIGKGAFLVPEGEGSLLLVEESGRRTHEVLAARGAVEVDWR